MGGASRILPVRGVEHVIFDPSSAQRTPLAVTDRDQLAHRRAFEA